MAKCRNILMLIFFAGILGACANSQYDFAAFTPSTTSNNPQSTTPPSCSTTLQGMTVPVKVMLVVDQSGSNVSASGSIPASDPNKTVRAGSIQQFFNNYKTKTNFSWSFIGFNDGTAMEYVSGAPSNNPNNMQSAINQFTAATDEGGTPYSAALDMARREITNDHSSADTKYIVVFLSDGMPDSGFNSRSEVQAVLNAAPGQVTFNAIYYGATNPDASNLMKDMATEGLGRFLDTNANPNGKSFQIGDVVYVPGC